MNKERFMLGITETKLRGNLMQTEFHALKDCIQGTETLGIQDSMLIHLARGFNTVEKENNK